ncbi:MAG: hypothetical protein GY757_31660 [bacterium]|nr:hypothetical protein [bacterium]
MQGDIKTGASNPENIGPWHIDPKEWFIAGYGPFRRLPDSAFSVQGVKSKARRIAQLSSLFREDATLVESIPWLKEIYLRRLDYPITFLVLRGARISNKRAKITINPPKTTAHQLIFLDEIHIP